MAKSLTMVFPGSGKAPILFDAEKNVGRFALIGDDDGTFACAFLA